VTTPLQGGPLLAEQGAVLGLVGCDQTPEGGPSRPLGTALSVGIKLGEARPLLALPEAIDGAHLGASSRVLLATAIGDTGCPTLAVLAIAGEATTADVEVLRALDLRAG